MATCTKCNATYNAWTASYGDGLCLSCHQEALEEAEIKKKKENLQIVESTKTTIGEIITSLTKDRTLHVTFVNWGVEKKLRSFVQKLPGLVAGAALGGAGGEMLFGGTLMSKNKAIYGGELGVLIVTENRLILGHTTSIFEDEAGSIGPDHIQLLKSVCDSKKIKLKEFDIKHTQVSIEQLSSRSPEHLDSGARLEIKNKESTLSCSMSIFVMDPVPYEQASFASISSSLEGMGSLCTPYRLAECLTKNENPLLEYHIEDVIENKGFMKEVIGSVYAHRHIRDPANLSVLAPPVKKALVARLKARADSYRVISFFLYLSLLLTLAFILGSILSNDDDWQTFFIIVSIIAGIAAIVFWRRKVHVIWCQKYLESNKLI